MAYEKTILVEILSEINKFNESISKNFKEFRPDIFFLGYCFNKDTLHSFYFNNRCYNCSGLEKENIKISGFEFKEFKKHFGKKVFAHKLIDLIDTWPEKNNFPYEQNLGIKNLPEHEKLIDLYYFWNILSEEKKFNQLFDIGAIQKEYHETEKKLNKLSRFLY